MRCTVVPVDDPAALADAIVLRLGDVARRAREGNASRARAMAEFDIARAERAIDDLYEELVAVRPPRSS